jgi:uncharacterized protein with NRDE domain
LLDPVCARRHPRYELAADFLCGTEAPDAYVEKISNDAGSCNGLNLLVGDAGSLHHLSNRGRQAARALSFSTFRTRPDRFRSNA